MQPNNPSPLLVDDAGASPAGLFHGALAAYLLRRPAEKDKHHDGDDGSDEFEHRIRGRRPLSCQGRSVIEAPALLQLDSHHRRRW